ncbi:MULTISPECIES: SDR family oxidoreductase [unclassified Streptomyces]|uniref:SDR family oxidoreductase n=1 Tax=unclassified Streptomyces TaxID=2593676 RepID=UPI002E35A048|nr:SDR family oxidoreductase [Streptomyces sp. NBC_01261]WSX55587.1 SDR family oxidoreductase [Streptomyces sp. NBC_00986]
MSRSVLITGGNHGIGHAAVCAFLQHGDHVAFTHYTEGASFDLVHDGALPVYCDITDPEQVESAFKEVEADQGPVDVLVVNAGITRDNPLRTPEEAFAAVLDTDLTASCRLATRAVRAMLRTKRGRIILVPSAVALKAEAQADYVASTAGLVDFGRSLAREIGPSGITVDTVSPGLTGMAMAGDVPLGRIGNPEEIASAIAFLFSEEAAFDTGVRVPVGGGISVGQ